MFTIRFTEFIVANNIQRNASTECADYFYFEWLDFADRVLLLLEY